MFYPHLLMILAVVIGWFGAAAARADDELASPRVNQRAAFEAMQAQVDELLAKRWTATGVHLAEPASEAEFLRRAYLDLTGRLPPVSRVRSFLADEQPDKCDHLIDELLGSPHYATHMATQWKEMLLPGGLDQQQLVFSGPFTTWLRGQFAESRPYDRLVGDLLLASGQYSQSSSLPLFFYTANRLQPEELAANVSRSLLGVQIQCAQCHNHPFDHWTQRDFWSFAAFFAQLEKPANAQQLQFSQVRDVDTGEVMLPGTEEVLAPRFLQGDFAKPQAGETRRQLLTAWLTSADNRYFARAAVNRLWAHMFGRGLVHPVDDLGDHNPASHPELLNELAKYFAQSGFDVANMLRLIASTKAYRLSSAGSPGDLPPPELFARMAIKTISATSLYECLGDAVLRPNSGVGVAGRASAFRPFDQARQQFVGKFSTPTATPTEYQSGILQALTLMNGELVTEATDPVRSPLLISLELPQFTAEDRVEVLYLATLSRFPNDSERARSLEYLKARGESQQSQALADLLWVLVNGAEFVLNH